MLRSEPAGTPSHVIVLHTLGAPERHRLRRRRPRRVDAHPPPTPVATARATVIEAAPLPDSQSAQRRLKATDLDSAAAAALVTLNRVLAWHRIASADPWSREVALAQALVVRVGYGAGQEVAGGEFTEALELPAQTARRRRPGEAALRPQERLAALLGARTAPLACEEIALRARADVIAGRWREAALQTDLGVRLALVELDRAHWAPDAQARLAELRELSSGVGDAAQSALTGRPAPTEIDVVTRALERLEAALRARAAQGSALGMSASAD